MKRTDPLIIVEELYDTSLENVWNSITDPNEMNKWFFEQIKSFKAEEGFETEFTVEVENRKFTHLWKIVDVSPYHKIKYQWKYLEYSGNSFVTFELKEENGKVRLILTAEVLEDFSENIPEFKRESCVGGWNYFIKDSLRNYLTINA